jgi:Zn-dependent protease with chaperone function
MDIIILAIAITTVLGLFFYVRDMGVLGYSRFTEFDFVDSDRKVKIAAVGVITLLSYLLIYIGYRMADLVFLRGDVSLLIRFSGLLILLGVAYFPAGIVYQTGRYWWKNWRLLQDSKPVELPFEADNTCLKIGFPGSDPVYFASTVSTGMSDYVVVSEDLASDFEDDELEAVVRHEEEHIQSGDVRISFLIMIGSVLTLVGRNIYYVLIDFRGREFRADRKAASDVSPQSMKNALERFKNNGLDYGPQTGAAIVSFGGSGRDAKGLYRYFDLFFGDYGIREAHPSIDKRISKIEE